METAKIWGRRSSCPRAQVGVVIARESRIISIGYIGSPPGREHCFEVGCLMDNETNSCLRGIHAEMNAIGFAARNGIETKGSDMYVTLSPCIHCAQIIVAAGIQKVIYLKEYKDLKGIRYLEDNGIFTASFFEILSKGGEIK